MTEEERRDLKDAIDIVNNTSKPATIYKLRIMQAFVDGFPIEFTYRGEWFPIAENSEPLWDWGSTNYRIRRG